MFKEVPQEKCFDMLAILPEVICFDILTIFPVKSLLRLTCVSKSWNSLISSTRFIDAYQEINAMKSACQYILVKTRIKEWSLFCDETFSKCFDLMVPKNHFSFSINGSCNGLICIHDSINQHLNGTVYLCNPSIRKFKRLPQGLIRSNGHDITQISLTLGFGFYPEGNDYKVVRILRFYFLGQRILRFRDAKPIFKIEIYSLRLDSWRRIRAVPPVSSDAYLGSKYVCFNGVVYWIAEENSPRFQSILSFDMGSEIFQKQMLPKALQRSDNACLSIQVFEKSLSLFHRRRYHQNDHYFCEIWVLEMDTWKMIRTISSPPLYGQIAWPLVFTRNGVLIIPNNNWPNLVFYDPKSQQVKDSGIKLSSVDMHGCYVDAYKDSLILLDS